MPIYRTISQAEREPARFLISYAKGDLSYARGVLAGGQGLVEDGTVVEQRDDQKLYIATGNEARVAGIIIGDQNTAAGDVKVRLVSQSAEVTVEDLVLPADSTEGSTLIDGLTESQVVHLALRIRLDITVRRRNDVLWSPLDGIPAWQQYIPWRF